MDALAAAGALAGVAGAVLVHAYVWPWQPCPHCRGRKGRNWGSTDETWGDCRRCGGSGKRIRPVSRIHRKWRAEARKRRT